MMTNTKDNLAALNDMGNRGYDSLRELGEINLRNWEKLLGRQMDALSFAMESGVQQMKVASEAKGYNDLVKGQVEFVKSIGERALRESKANLELANATREEYRAWFEKGVKTFSDKTKETIGQSA
jgi:phasin family protein